MARGAPRHHRADKTPGGGGSGVPNNTQSRPRRPTPYPSARRPPRGRLEPCASPDQLFSLHSPRPTLHFSFATAHAV